jgi:phage terminase large subunit-like protein
VVVAVDPPVTGHSGSDDCGIVVVGAVMQGPPQQWRAFVIEDASVSGASPAVWAEAVAAAAARHQADRVVAEVNQGGDLVTEVLRQVNPAIPVKTVRATRGKHLRAEPVAALYEQGRVHHVAGARLAALEDQLCRMTVQGWQGKGSPDRLDALVWAIHELMLGQAGDLRPQMRGL